MSNLLFLPDHEVRDVHITRDGDFIIHTEARPSHERTPGALPVRKIKGKQHAYRVFVTEIQDGNFTIPFCTVTVDKKALA